MTDRYERIRAALAMGPTPGPWVEVHHEGSRWTDIYQDGDRRYATPVVYVPPLSVLDENGVWKKSNGETAANAKHIAACDPDTIRELLAERDALAAAIEAAQAERDVMREALEDIRSRMRLDPFDRLAELDNIHQIADAALSAAERADGGCR